ncbi:MAG: penicillin-binding protein 2 [candidate division WOR-3 bacterium]|nr:penicillin-binding protein 2 [candidate division WOR-3 bacterium]
MEIEFRRRKLIFLIGLFLLIIIGKLFQLQIIAGKRYFRLAEANRIRKVFTPAARGKIFDRNRSILADSRPAFALSVIPCEMDSLTMNNLMDFAQIDNLRIKDWLTNFAYLRTPIKIKRNLDLLTVLKIEENSKILPGVSIEIEPVRTYPLGPSSAHLIGYLGEVTPEEMKSDTYYRPWHYTGRSGIEAQYEKYLRGKEGIRYAEIDAAGREIGPLPEKREVLPVAGNDIYLTIDAELQKLSYELISKYKRAAVVGIDLKDGGILCLVSQPSFNAELLTQGMASSEWQKIIKDKSSPLLNRALMSSYPPGSTIKPLIALAGLESNLIDKETRFSPCQGSFPYGNRKYKCWTKHGSLNLTNAIAYSCNIYFYQLGLKLGLDRLTSYLLQWRINEKTNIDLQPERAGNVPTREYLDKRYGKNQWTSGVIPNLAIGQGEILVTPLQLAVLYSVIAGDGEFYEPHLLKMIKNGDKIVYEFTPKKRKIPITLENIKIIKQALIDVVKFGTGGGAYLPSVTVAGKTGTAENPPHPDHAWFVGYAPAENPEVVFCVIVENVGKGGAIAAPIVQQLMQKYFSLKNQITHNE